MLFCIESMRCPFIYSEVAMNPLAVTLSLLPVSVVCDPHSQVLMGPAIAPLVGGIFTEYTALTWRSSQYFLAGVGCLALALTFFFLPETSHPPLPHTLLKEEQGKKFVVYYFNPLTSLGLFRWPNICMVVSFRPSYPHFNKIGQGLMADSRVECHTHGDLCLLDSAL